MELIIWLCGLMGENEFGGPAIDVEGFCHAVM
jgi:hypothetical protein